MLITKEDAFKVLKVEKGIKRETFVGRTKRKQWNRNDSKILVNSFGCVDPKGTYVKRVLKWLNSYDGALFESKISLEDENSVKAKPPCFATCVNYLR